MTLSDLSAAERTALALRIGRSPKYLHQLAYGTVDVKTGEVRQPSTALCKQLVAADPRLTLAELRPDVWGHDEIAA